MKNVPSRYTQASYAAMRFFVGALFLCHGAQKVFGAFGAQPAEKPLMLIGGILELVCGSLVAAGLLTHVAAFVASGEMAVAYFMSHAAKGFWPIQNGGENAVLYCFAFLFIAAFGGGIFSVDEAIARAAARTVASSSRRAFGPVSAGVPRA